MNRLPAIVLVSLALTAPALGEIKTANPAARWGPYDGWSERPIQAGAVFRSVRKRMGR
jgi:hypothetical protein